MIFPFARRNWTDFVEAQSLRVGFQGFFVVLLCLLYEAEDMPTYVGRKVESYAFLHEINTLLALPHMC